MHETSPGTECQKERPGKGKNGFYNEELFSHLEEVQHKYIMAGRMYPPKLRTRFVSLATGPGEKGKSRRFIRIVQFLPSPHSVEVQIAFHA